MTSKRDYADWDTVSSRGEKNRAGTFGTTGTKAVIARPSVRVGWHRDEDLTVLSNCLGEHRAVW